MQPVRHTVERAGIVPQRVCDVWTASWVNCMCLGEPITRDSQDEREKITRTAYVRNTEGIWPIWLANGRMKLVLLACQWMSSTNPQLLHLASNARALDCHVRIGKTLLFHVKAPWRVSYVNTLLAISCFWTGPEPFAIVVCNAGATYEHQARLQCNCGDCCDDQLHSSPQPFCKSRCLGCGTLSLLAWATVWYASKCLGKLNPSNVIENVVTLWPSTSMDLNMGQCAPEIGLKSTKEKLNVNCGL